MRVTRETQLQRPKEKVSREARRAMVIEHMDAEVKGEIDRLMATVSPNPRWDLHPLGYFDGWDACRELYVRCSPFAPDSPMEIAKGLDDPRVAMWGDDHCLFHMAIFPTEYPMHANATTLIKFDGNLIQGEISFMSHPDFIEASRVHLERIRVRDIPGFKLFPNSPWPGAA